jgi:hypothetical protein
LAFSRRTPRLEAIDGRSNSDELQTIVAQINDAEKAEFVRAKPDLWVRALTNLSKNL